MLSPESLFMSDIDKKHLFTFCFDKNWESNLNFKEEIEKNSRKFLEDKITPNFFKSGSSLDKIEEE